MMTKLRSTVVFTAVVLALTSCGGTAGDEGPEVTEAIQTTTTQVEDDGATTQPASTSTTISAPLSEVTGVSSTNSFSAGPLLYIDVNESMLQHGIELDLRYVLNNPAVLAALLSNQTDIAAIGCQGILDANLDEAGKLQVLAGLTNASHQLFLTTEAVEASGVTPDSPIEERLQALEGLNLAASPAGTTTNAFLNQLVTLAGFDPNTDVNILPAAEPATMVAGVRTGEFDGALYGAGAFGELIEDGTGVMWIDGYSEIPELASVPTFCLSATSEWIEENAGAAALFNQAVADAIAAMQSDTSYNPQIKEAFFPDMAQEAFEATWNNAVPPYPAGAKVSELGFEQLKAIQAAVTRQDYSSVSYTDSLIAEAQE